MTKWVTSMATHVAQDLDLLHARAQQVAHQSRRPTVVSFTVRAAEPLDVIALFERAAILGHHRSLWMSPDEPRAMVGVGAAAVLEAAGTRPVSSIGRTWTELLAAAMVDVPHGVWGTGPVLVGGTAFDPSTGPDPVWAQFPPARFILPEFLATVTRGETWLTFNQVVVPDHDGGRPKDQGGAGPAWAATPAAESHGCSWPGAAGWPASSSSAQDGVSSADRLASPGPVFFGGGEGPGAARWWVPSRTADLGERVVRWLSLASMAAEASGPSQGAGGDAGRGAAAGGDWRLGAAAAAGPLDHRGAVVEEWPDAAGWTRAVEAALDAIRGGALRKVVLARRVRVQGPAAFDPGLVLRRLRSSYPGCFLFAFAVGHRIFLGASPERLVRLRDGRLETAALAGSSRRGATPADDRRLAEGLLQDAKELAEHRLVVEMLRQALAPVCRTLSVAPAPKLLRLANVQHLTTPVVGSVDGRSVLDLVERLHPTPAVGGWPRDEALRFIRRWEPGSRGWYAAPVGWVDRRGQGEFAVAIRSGLLRGAEAWLYAGCGIVDGSDPRREYEETGIKLRPLLTALGVAGSEVTGEGVQGAW